MILLSEDEVYVFGTEDHAWAQIQGEMENYFYKVNDYTQLAIS